MRELFRHLWNAVRSDRLAIFGLSVLCILITLALLAPIIATHDPTEMNYRAEGSALWIEGGETYIDAGVTEHSLRSVATDDGGFTAVGEKGTIAVYRGTRADGAWEIIDTGNDETLRSVAVSTGAGGAPALAVGDGGLILYRDGTGAWHREHAPGDPSLTGAALAASTGTAHEVLRIAVGEDGTVLVSRVDSLRNSLDGVTAVVPWETISPGVARDLLDVALADDEFGFVVGQRGTILRWNGMDLEAMESPTFRDLLAVAVRDRDYALAVGERGTVLLWDGQVWSEMSGPLSRSLRSVSIGEDGRAIVVGNFGDMMALEDGEWRRLDSGYDRHFRGSTVVGEAYLAVGTDPYVNALASPSRDHLFGTTHNGRDIFSQVLYGGRTALAIGFLAAIMVTVIGTNVGLVSGYFGGRTDSVLMRIVDIMYALPLEPFAMILVLVWRPGVGVIILAVGLLTWRTTARLIRSQVLSIVRRPFVKAARMAGSGHARIMYVHIAPNVLPLTFLQLAVAMAFAITAEATLSFLGLGPPRLYSWGTILHQARLSGAWRTAWWWIVPPGVLIMITVVSVFFVSRALEVVANPRLRRQ
jgi:peptide/nickel transport system permease protein